MKHLQLILVNVTGNLTAYLAELEEQNERTQKFREKLHKTTTVEDFVVRSISTHNFVKENVWSNRFARIRELFQNKDLYNPIVITDLTQVTNRTMLMAAINHTTEKGLPFKLKGYSISYYRLPSSGPHPAVHFWWKRSINDTLDCPEQLKLIHELKNESKTCYSRAMKNKFWIQILKLGIAKPCQANFLINIYWEINQLHLMIAKLIYFID